MSSLAHIQQSNLYLVQALKPWKLKIPSNQTSLLKTQTSHDLREGTKKRKGDLNLITSKWVWTRHHEQVKKNADCRNRSRSASFTWTRKHHRRTTQDRHHPHLRGRCSGYCSSNGLASQRPCRGPATMGAERRVADSPSVDRAAFHGRASSVACA